MALVSRARSAARAHRRCCGRCCSRCYPRTRHLLVRAVAFLFLLSYLLPAALASAAVVFARSGAGVSRLPLAVLGGVEVAGFGEFVDAVNVVNGGVFVRAAGLARNNLVGASDEGVASIGGSGWLLENRLRLWGFNADMLSVPDSFVLGRGDGSSQHFRRSELLASSPGWIARYEGVPEVALYRSVPRLGSQFKQEWLALVPLGARVIAHYYDAQGNRVSFLADGEYADYAQNPHQQLQGASAGDAEG